MFELNEALRKWRDSLKGKNTLLETDIKELESHLLEEREILKGKGLSEEEAFRIASRRLGETGELSREFSKVDGNHIWGQRLLWMAMGLLSYLLMNHLIQLTNGICVTIAAANGVKGYNLRVVSIASAFSLMGSAVFGYFAIVSRYGISLRERIFKSAGTAKRRMFYLIGFIGLITIMILSKIPTHLIAARYMIPRSMGEFHMVSAIASMLWSPIFPVLLVIFIFHNRRKFGNPV